MLTAYAISNTDSLINVQGPDAQKYLQGQLTCDMQAISVNKAGLGAYCNLKGRCVGLFRIIQISEQQYILRINTSTVPLFLQQLKKYAMFSKVTIEDVSASWHAYVVEGEFPGEIYTCVHANSSVSTKLEPPLNWWQWLAPRTTPTPAEFNIIHNDAAWQYLEISCGIPTLCAATQEKLLPHNLNLVQLGAVSFTKGCFLGQEIIARMQHLGQIKKHLYLYKYNGELEPSVNQLLFNNANKEIGQIVNVGPAPEGGYAILAIVADEQVDEVNLDGKQLSSHNPLLL